MYDANWNPFLDEPNSLATVVGEEDGGGDKDEYQIRPWRVDKTLSTLENRLIRLVGPSFQLLVEKFVIIFREIGPAG